ncbi:MAG: hypothetical protein QW253_00060 [Metallosphaera sp.]
MAKLAFLPKMQVYFSVPWSRKPLTLRPGPPWIGDPEKLSVPQLRAALELSRAAYEKAYGKTGKERYKGVLMPRPAVIIAETVKKGPGVHGGITPEERRRRAHARARATIAYLEALLRAKGAAAPAPTE